MEVCLTQFEDIVCVFSDENVQDIDEIDKTGVRIEI